MTDKWISYTGHTVVENPNLNVYDAALARIRHLFSLSKNYVVSFSGGKDSTTVLMLSLQVAKELGRLPLEVAYIDEEVIDPDTLAYVDELRYWNEISLRWFCVPIRHTLRSRSRTHWETWDPKAKDVWARPMPEWAITHKDIPTLKEEGSYGDVIKAYYLKTMGFENFVDVAGVRAAEAFNRRRVLLVSGSYIVLDANGKHIYSKPIYDWRTPDVWKAILMNHWPHSAYYDKLWAEQVGIESQRVAPWGNVASSRETRHYASFYPDFWEKATRRLPELTATARYGATALYREVQNKPVGMTWQDYAGHLLKQLDFESQDYWNRHIGYALERYAKKHTTAFPEDGDTLSWKSFCFRMSKNDRMKGSSRDRA